CLVVPAVDMSSPFGPEAFRFSCDPGGQLLEDMRRVWKLHSPLNFSGPGIDRDKILFLSAKGDHLCPFDSVLALCEKWGWPRHRFFRGGHWLMDDRGERGRAWHMFLDDMEF
ncbi:MAG: hypothetical protein JRI97_13285, partial [Deltaproteobacteria bacterium]|nr:hypothetical protein [Deltaproteobacteria bacterium]